MGCGAGTQAQGGAVTEAKAKAPGRDEQAQAPAVASSSSLPPLPVNPDGVKRLVIAEQLFKLNPVWADKLLNSSGSHSLPVQAAQAVSWHRSRWELWEEEEGLQLLVQSRAVQDSKKLVTWSGHPSNHLEVEALPPITLEGSRKSPESKHVKRAAGDSAPDVVKVEVIDIPEEHRADPTELHPFLMRWKADGDRQKCLVVGCEEETSCNKWVNNLMLYSNIGKRFCGVIMWKLNADVGIEKYQENGGTLPEEDLGDLRNWRRRLCYLEQLHRNKALCITYISEKSDAEERVANILAIESQGEINTIGTVRPLPDVKVRPLEPAETAKVTVSVQQYDIAVANQGLNDSRVVVLPETLALVEVRQPDDSQGGQQHTIFGFDHAEMSSRWLAAIERAGEKLTRGMDVPPLRLVLRE